MKKILFVINTMGRAGAEIALLELLKKLDGREYDISLYVLMGQGEMIEHLPPYVRLLNARYSAESVLSTDGRKRMVRTVLLAFIRNGKWFGKLCYIVKNLIAMARIGRVQIDKLLWRVVSDGAERFEDTFDLAVAWLEGGSAYYVADHVKAQKKSAFIHIDFERAGYTKGMDQGCWEQYERIFVVSEEVKEHFRRFYPEYASKVKLFHNVVDQEAIRRRSKEAGGFSDKYGGTRLLTVGRLTWQKAYDIAVEAMKILKDSGYQVRWYVLGEGGQRRMLEKKIAELGLEEDFLLLGACENPYPYYRQADIYVHAARFEGRSIAIQEAQTLGCAVVASDCSNNQGQITDHVDGILCELTPSKVAAGIATLLQDEEKRKSLGRKAEMKEVSQGQELLAVLGLLP